MWLFASILASDGRQGFALCLLLVVGVLGCTGPRQTVSQSPGVVAFQYLPREASADHAPDVLRSLSLADDSTSVTFEQPFASVLAKWSVRHRYAEAPPARRRFLNFRGGSADLTDLNLSNRVQNAAPFATLGSKEVTLTRLYATTTIEDASPREARTRITDRLRAYADTLRIDVYFPVLPLSEVRSTSVTLTDKQNVHYPIVGRSYALGSATDRGRQVDYRRLSLYVDRTVEGRDALSSTQGLRLRVSSAGDRDWEFVWTWPADDSFSPVPAADQ